MQNFNKQPKWSGDMVKLQAFPPNLALICLTGSENTGFTDDVRRTTYDGRTDDGRLRDDRSSAVQQQKAELKHFYGYPYNANFQPNFADVTSTCGSPHKSYSIKFEL